MFDCSFAHWDPHCGVSEWDFIPLTANRYTSSLEEHKSQLAWHQMDPQTPSIHTFIHTKWWFITMVTEYKKERHWHSWSVTTTKRKGELFKWRAEVWGRRAWGVTKRRRDTRLQQDFTHKVYEGMKQLQWNTYLLLQKENVLIFFSDLDQTEVNEPQISRTHQQTSSESRGESENNKTTVWHCGEYSRLCFSSQSSTSQASYKGKSPFQSLHMLLAAKIYQ